MDRSRCLKRSGLLREIVALKRIDAIVPLAEPIELLVRLPWMQR